MVRVQVFHNVGPTRFFRYEPGDPLVLVHRYEVEAPLLGLPQHAIRGALERVYFIFNVGDDPTFGSPHPEALRYRQRCNRSLSVGDVVAIGEMAYHVAPASFLPVTGEINVVTRTEYGTTPLIGDHMGTYKIVRFYQDENHPDHRKVIATGLTLAEAQAHCRDESTHGEGWFDGFEGE